MFAPYFVVIRLFFFEGYGFKVSCNGLMRTNSFCNMRSTTQHNGPTLHVVICPSQKSMVELQIKMVSYMGINPIIADNWLTFMRSA